jgi:arabinogalactan endo-1,4-beta-galactosidase
MIMKKILISVFAAFSALTMQAQPADVFARGADVSWCTEMEADGKRFYNANGEETELMALMKQIGMNAIRLRVWVNPEKAYGPWCDKADVLAKARRAHEQGLALLIDFHYSDFFADPGRQDKPSAWTTYSMDEVKKAVADHTRDVLQALKDEGIEPQWVQVGNETRSGMIWESGRIDWNKSGSARYTNYVALSNAGYEAVHAVLPEAKVIVHIDKGPDDNAWFYREFKAAGGKFDMIGLSHYPESNWQNENTKTANNVKSLGQTFGVPVMIVETGYSVSNETLAEQVMTDLFSKTQSLSQCAGIFYWEPELYGWWKPAYYTKLGWNAYGKGAFTSQGRPGKALNAFQGDPTGISRPSADPATSNMNNAPVYDLQGRSIANGNIKPNEIYMIGGRKVVKR